MANTEQQNLPQMQDNKQNTSKRKKRKFFSRKRLDLFVEHFLKPVLRFIRIRIPDKEELNRIIFYSDTKYGRKFDIYLLYAISISVIIPILDSISVIHELLHWPLVVLEITLTVSFTIEYLLRIYCAHYPIKYIISFFGIVDALSIFPFYLAILFPGLESLATIRILRILRVFRILNMRQFVSETYTLLSIVKNSIRKIIIFMMFVFMVTIILGSFMYSIENGRNPAISSIPKGIYWAIVTLTTVGYGDITPVTDLGQIIASIVMILGYSFIAVPTGIIGGEVVSASQNKKSNSYGHYKKRCAQCGYKTKDASANFCQFCGTKLHRIYKNEDENIAINPQDPNKQENKTQQS